MGHTSPLGKRIRRAIEEKGWTRNELKRRTNIPYSTLAHIDSSQHTVHTSEENIKVIAKALDIPYEELRILAGYAVAPSPTLDEATQRLATQLQSFPQLQRAISTLLGRGDKEEIDQTSAYLEWRSRQKR
jgi:transcriptional regulator with XRE-family HTH domain